ncbi:MAG: DUF3043 domain-containing protein [Nostocoides sp.]
MFGRKDKVITSESLESATHEDRPGAKNRPTPKRRDQEAARKQPLVVTDRKQAREKDRAARLERRTRMNEAMATGDDRYLPARDKGPIRRYIRDRVDARRSAGEFLLPAMIIVLALSFIRQNWATLAVMLLTYVLIIAAAVDSFVMWRSIKKGIYTKFGQDTQIPRGSVMYAVMRAFQMRRTRMPKPQVERGAVID